MEKINLREILRTLWFYKIAKWIYRDRSLCLECRKEKGSEEYRGLCWSCYFKNLKKE